MTEDLGRAERQALEIEALGNEIVTRLPAALEMLRQYKRGYPTGGDATGDGTSRTEALGIAPPDAIDREQRELSHCLDRALRALQTAYNITARYGYSRRPDRPSDDPDSDIWCRNCIRHGHMAVCYRGDACRDCYDFKLVEGVVRPKMLIEAKARGERITQALVSRSLGRKCAS